MSRPIGGQTNHYYAPDGRPTQEVKSFSDSAGRGFTVDRRIRYNRRGQRTWVREEVIPLGGAIVTGDRVNYRTYTYDNLTGRLLQAEAKSAATLASATFTFSQVTIAYDAAGRTTRQAIRLYEPSGASDSLVTAFMYDSVTGRVTSQATTGHGSTYYAMAASNNRSPPYPADRS